MKTDRTLWITAIAAIGAALVVFPFLPGKWPNPLPQGDRLDAVALRRLERAAERVDEACSRGDLDAFSAAVTEALRERLRRQLAAVQRDLDAETLTDFRRQLPRGYSDLLRLPILASEVRGERTAVAVELPDGDDAQLLEFVWDGRALRLDGSRRAVEAASKGRARALVVDAAGN